ncbi:hypothetical protein Enr8_28120 [Blastopirellula retiformator]|uniref:Uncharacterized protein n=1 Tax=Blastopirellula retiformator TaxID=2527970 RepID=A0A5C5V306_9BACT|nr:hypothetical protein Enr8_28120 [Blastopirellula retiformator]
MTVSYLKYVTITSCAVPESKTYQSVDFLDGLRDRMDASREELRSEPGEFEKCHDGIFQQAANRVQSMCRLSGLCK